MMNDYLNSCTFGDVRAVLRQMIDAGVQVDCIVTSPPYWSLRAYLPPGHEMKQYEMGSEPTLTEFIAGMTEVFMLARDILKPSGTCFINMGDAYAGTWGATGRPQGTNGDMNGRKVGDARIIVRKGRPGKQGAEIGLKPKDLMGQPWRLAFALQDAGWWLRQDIIWAKKNPMPESTKDRFTKGHEYIFFLTKSQRYYFDQNAVKEPASEGTHQRVAQPAGWDDGPGGHGSIHRNGRNPGKIQQALADDPNGEQRTKSNLQGGSAAYYARLRGTGVGFGHGYDENPKPRVVAATPKAALATIAESGAYVDGKSERIGRGAGWRNKNNESFDAAMAVMPLTRNPRSVWFMASQPYKEAHFACVDDQTEALTQHGWRQHSNLVDGEQIAAYNRTTGVLEWQEATFHRYAYDADLVAIQKRDSSQRLTPNHRVLVKRRSGRLSVVQADALTPGMQIPLVAPLASDEVDGPGEWLAALLGWFVTEGEKKFGKRVRINQSISANPDKVKTIRAILAAMGADSREYTRTREWRGRPSEEMVFSVGGHVAETLRRMSPHKSIDWTWLKWPERDIRAFVDAVIDGDGHRRPDGRRCVVQKSREFLSALQAMVLRLGWRGHISKRSDGGHVLYITEGQWLTLRGTNGEHKPMAREHYAGTVWCPSVPSGFWLARREGKPFITGNTFPEELAERCILAGCPPGGTVLDIFMGSGTTAQVAQRIGRNWIGIDLDERNHALQQGRISAQGAFVLEQAA